MTTSQQQIYDLTHISVSDFYLMSSEWQEKIRYYAEETGKNVSDWQNLQALDERTLSQSFICIQAFGNDHKKAAKCWQDTTKMAEQASRAFLEEHFYSKIGNPSSPIVPEGWTYITYKAAMFRGSKQAYLQVFAKHFNKYLEIWMDKNGIL